MYMYSVDALPHKTTTHRWHVLCTCQRVLRNPTIQGLRKANLILCSLAIKSPYTDLIVLSDEPLTTSLSLYCRQAMPRL